MRLSVLFVNCFRLFEALVENRRVKWGASWIKVFISSITLYNVKFKHMMYKLTLACLSNLKKKNTPVSERNWTYI